MSDQNEQNKNAIQRAPSDRHARGNDLLASPPPGEQHGYLLDAPLTPLGANTPAISLDMLLRQKWWILAITILVSAAAIPCIWSFITPQYRSTALLQVSRVIPQIAFKNEEKSVPDYEDFVNTQVGIIKSPTILNRVLDRKEVQETAWYRESPKGPPGVSELQEVVSVRHRRNSHLLDLSAITSSASDAQRVANAVVDEYRRYREGQTQQTAMTRDEALQNEINALEEFVKGKRSTRTSLSKALGTTEPEEVRARLTTQLSDLIKNKEDLELLYQMAQWDLQNIKTPAKQSEEDVSQESPEPSEDSFMYDEEWRRLYADVLIAENALDMQRQKYGDEHPALRASESSVQVARTLLSDRETQLREMAPGDVTESKGAGKSMRRRRELEYEAHRLAKQLELLDHQIELQEQRVKEKGELAHQIAEIDQEIRKAQSKLDTFNTRHYELQVEGKAPERVSVASLANVPSEPDRDRRLVLSVMALGGALMTGLAVGYLRSTFDRRVRQPDQVHRSISAPLLGQLPALTRRRDPATQSDATFLEGIRIVRTSFLGQLNGCDRRVFVLTSSSEQTGKSSIAVMLARSLAGLGKKVLLVEGDLRKPTLSRRLLGEEVEIGLAAVLCGIARHRDAIRITNLGNFQLLPAGRIPKQFDFELLANGRFSECMARWKKVYDFVLLDTPPVLAVADTRIMAAQADGTIMIVRSSHCRMDHLARASSDLGSAGADLVGTIMVDVEDNMTYATYAAYTAASTGR